MANAKAQTTVSSGSPQTIDCTIASGGTTSNIVFVDGKLVGIHIPDTFTAASLTFFAGITDANIEQIYDGALTATASARTIASANIPTSGGRYFSLALGDWLGVSYLQIVSSAAQSQATTFKLVLAG